MSCELRASVNYIWPQWWSLSICTLGTEVIYILQASLLTRSINFAVSVLSVNQLLYGMICQLFRVCLFHKGANGTQCMTSLSKTGFEVVFIQELESLCGSPSMPEWPPTLSEPLHQRSREHSGTVCRSHSSTLPQFFAVTPGCLLPALPCLLNHSVVSNSLWPFGL